MSVLTEEDRRALDWQARQRRIAANQMAIGSRLHGNPAAAQTVRDNWLPVILAQREARAMGSIDPDCEEDYESIRT